MADLPLTGERTLPGIPAENYWFRRHEAAYQAVAPFCRGAVVLEAGCGEGYGAAALTRVASRVVAVEADPVTATHAARRYPLVDVVRANLHRLPLRAGAAEAVVSLQVIEHLSDQAAFVAECARVLAPAGTLLLSTPNRLTFSPGGLRPRNPFHTRELDAAALRGLLEPLFTVNRLHGVAHGRRLRRLDHRFGSLVEAQLGRPAAAWTDRLRRAVAGVRAADFVLSDDLDRSLDLLAVATRRPSPEMTDG